MPANPPYLPNTDEGLASWASNFSSLITATPAAFGLVAGDAAIIGPLVTDYTDALTVASSDATRTPAAVAAKDAAKFAMIPKLRTYATRVSANPDVTEENKTALQVTVRNTTRTPVPAPTVAPLLSLTGSIPNAITLAYKNPALPAGKKKGEGLIGVETVIATGTAFVADPKDASRSETLTKSPAVVTFDPATRGQKATLFCRFVTRSGPGGIAQKGPWSAPLELTLV